MAKVVITIEDAGADVNLQIVVDPPIKGRRPVTVAQQYGVLAFEALRDALQAEGGEEEIVALQKEVSP
jgi:hypothetical protein